MKTIEIRMTHTATAIASALMVRMGTTHIELTEQELEDAPPLKLVGHLDTSVYELTAEEPSPPAHTLTDSLVDTERVTLVE